MAFGRLRTTGTDALTLPLKRWWWLLGAGLLILACFSILRDPDIELLRSIVLSCFWVSSLCESVPEPFPSLSICLEVLELRRQTSHVFSSEKF